LAPDIRSLFAQAVGHHQAGRLNEAIVCYRQVVALKPDLATAHHHLANALFGQGDLNGAEAGYRRALALQPTLATAHNNLGILLFAQDKVEDAEACYRQALSLESDYAEALSNLGALLWDRGRPAEAEASLRRALALAPDSTRSLETLSALLKDQGRQGEALAMVLHALSIAATPDAKRIFVDIAKRFSWSGDNRWARSALARALTDPWVRPAELATASASLIKQNALIGAAVARAAAAWPRPLPAPDLFGPGGLKPFADDTLLLALLVSAQNTDVELERFLTMARRAPLVAAAMASNSEAVGHKNTPASSSEAVGHKNTPASSSEAVGPKNDESVKFYAALARQCFINEYVFFHDEEEILGARGQRDALVAALDAGLPISPLQLLTVAAYFPLHTLSGAARLLDREWPAPVQAVLMQQVHEPLEEAQLRAAIPRLTSIQDTTSRLVREQYEENPYPRWVRMPPVEKASTITDYLHRKFPLAVFQPPSGGKVVEFLSAGCGTGQLALEIAQGVAARVLAIDLSLASLGYAKRKALELGLTDLEFAQADLLELVPAGRRFDVVECSGVLHHLGDPFAGWRALLPLLKPGGLMLVALYSEAARHGIVDARKFIAQKGYSASADDIRRCRQDLLTMDSNGGLGTGFGDFFGVSSCRDLLFHVQEQRMTLPAIARFLKDNDLGFLGFEIGKATLQVYRQRFPGDPAATDLQNWDAFESEQPDTFAGMYVFWLQKARA